MPSISVIVPVRNEAAVDRAHPARRCSRRTSPRAVRGDRRRRRIDRRDRAHRPPAPGRVRQPEARVQRGPVLLRGPQHGDPARHEGRGRGRGWPLPHSGPQLPPKNLSAAFDASGADCLGRPAAARRARPDAVPARRRASRGAAGSGTTRARTSTPISPSSCRRRARPSRTREACSTASGLFDEAFDACEDVEFNERVHAAGLTCYFTPSVKIVYEPRKSLARCSTSYRVTVLAGRSSRSSTRDR